MASIFRKTYRRPVPPGATIGKKNGVAVARWTDGRGRQRTAPLSEGGACVVLEYAKWSIEYTAADGSRATAPGFKDRRATEARAAELERAADRQRSGLADHDESMAARPIDDAIADWLADLLRQDRTPRYVYYCGLWIRQIAEGCSWACPGSIRSDTLARWLAATERKHWSARTRNAYLECARSFVGWCLSHRPPWLPGDPLAGLRKSQLTTRVAEKRALNADELARLRAVSGWRWDVYLCAALTGLRFDELKQLQWSDVYLDAELPHIHLRAKATKAKRADMVPLHPDVIAVLTRLRPANVNPLARVFPKMPKRKTYKRDVTERAGIPWRDERGRLASFHCLRKTFGTALAASGAPVRVAMELLRVTEAKLLTGIYTDAKLLNGSEAVSRLPSLDLQPTTDTDTDTSRSSQRNT